MHTPVAVGGLVDRGVAPRAGQPWAAYLHERDGATAREAELYAEATGRAADAREGDHLVRQGARLNALQ